MKAGLLITVLLAGASALAQTSIDTAAVVTVGGIKQYVSLKGSDRSRPLLLFLHGGPGGSVMDYAGRFTERLEEHFVVIQWDQRETGRTLELNKSPLPLSLARFQQDTHELIAILLQWFGRDKLYLAGHSWGTALGFHIAARYPELLYAYMPIGPMVNQLESEALALAAMKEKAVSTGNQEEQAELSAVHIPFETGEQLYYHRKWLMDFSGSRKKLSRSYVERWSARWLGVYNEACRENLLETLPALACPVYFFAGRKDYQTSSVITERYYQVLTAPKKALFWFEFSAHAIPSSEPERLQQLIIEKVLPETSGVRVAAGAP